MASKLIIFVCVSNTCRSPMCEFMMREKLRMAGLSGEYRVASRSLSTDYEPEGSPANEQGQLVMKNEYGIDTSLHQSKLLTTEDVSEADIIIPVKRDLGSYIADLYPRSTNKLQLFSEDISDPWRQPYPVYQQCAQMIERMVTEILQRVS